MALAAAEVPAPVVWADGVVAASTVAATVRAMFGVAVADAGLGTASVMLGTTWLLGLALFADRPQAVRRMAALIVANSLLRTIRPSVKLPTSTGQEQRCRESRWAVGQESVGRGRKWAEGNGWKQEAEVSALSVSA